MVKEYDSSMDGTHGVDYHKQRVRDTAADLKSLIGYRGIWYFLLGLAQEFYQPGGEPLLVKEDPQAEIDRLKKMLDTTREELVISMQARGRL